MMCPRCNAEDVELLVKAPKDNAWEVYICNTCTFSWRNTESENVTNPAKYDRRFKLDSSQFATLMEQPPVPPLAKK